MTKSTRIAVGALALGLFLPSAAVAQSVDECRVQIVEVQALIDARPDKDSDETKHAGERLIAAENEAAKGDAPKCMEIVEEARDVASR